MLPRTRSSDDREVWWISSIELLRDEMAAFCKKSVRWAAARVSSTSSTRQRTRELTLQATVLARDSRELSVRSCMGYGAVAGAHGSR